MTHYGMMLNIGTLVFLNGVGLLLNAIYSLLYIAVSKDKVRYGILTGLSGSHSFYATTLLLAE